MLTLMIYMTIQKSLSMGIEIKYEIINMKESYGIDLFIETVASL